MPLYEYECDACGHRFETIRKFSDPPLEVCPKCGGHVRKLIASPAFQFKGTGWYITDYAKKDSSGAGKTSGSSSEADKGSSSDTKETPAKSESTPAASESSSHTPPKTSAKDPSKS